jgi:hypothetical protein
MSFDLMVLALDDGADAEVARRMLERCNARVHPEGELDERIVAFYEELRSAFPDYPPFDPESPWMSMPLNVGIDHVFMHLSYSARSTRAIDKIEELTARHRLVLYDPQSDDVHLPRPDDSDLRSGGL